MGDQQPPPPPPLYLRSFLAHDYGGSCAPNYYCMSCSMGICAHCCPGHRVRHHDPDDRVFYPQVRIMDRGFGPSVDALEVKGCGYDWTGIRRVRYGSYAIFIPLHPRVGEHHGNQNHLCPGCHAPTAARRTCCTSCRLDTVPDGDPLGRQIAEALVGTDFHQHFQHDTFCTRCRLFFSSHFCGTHIQSHHPGLGGLITVVRDAQGMVLTPVHGVLPHGLLDGIQIVDFAGVPMVPVLSMQHPLDGEVGTLLCHSCMQMIPDGFDFCSIYCKAEHHGWL